MKVCPITHQECIPDDCKSWTSTETIDPDCLLFGTAEILHRIKARLDVIDEVIARLPSEGE